MIKDKRLVLFLGGAPNNGMQRSADTHLVMLPNGVARPLMPGVRFLLLWKVAVYMKKLASAFGAALLCITAASALARECPPKPLNQTAEQARAAFLEEVEKATVIFSGKVIESDVFQARFKVEKVWKGDLQGKVIILTGAKRHEDGSYSRWSSDYGGYRLGRKYIVWASGPADELKADACSRTGVMEDAEQDVKELDALKASGSERLNPKPRAELAIPRTKSNNGMHPTADTLLLKFLQRCGAAGDARR